MSESIALIIKSFEVIMEKYGFWKVNITLMLYLLIWQFSNISTSLRAWF